jgi:hypothetical protein
MRGQPTIEGTRGQELDFCGGLVKRGGAGCGFSSLGIIDSHVIIHKRRSLGKLLGGRGQELLHEKP